MFARLAVPVRNVAAEQRSAAAGPRGILPLPRIRPGSGSVAESLSPCCWQCIGSPGASSAWQPAKLGPMQYEDHQKALARYLETHNLKRTKQREEILGAFLDAGGHLTGEDLYQLIRKRAPRIGYTTVYRTLKLFVEAGLAEEHHFDDGVTRYEIEHKHHDHLVCILCGKILEFESKEIEQAQKVVADDLGFTVLRHRHELYGHCSDCSASKRG